MATDFRLAVYQKSHSNSSIFLVFSLIFLTHKKPTSVCYDFNTTHMHLWNLCCQRYFFTCDLFKAELLLLKLIYFFAREVLLVRKLEIKETKTTYSTFKTEKVGPFFLISNFFIAKMPLANKWMRKTNTFLQ